MNQEFIAFLGAEYVVNNLESEYIEVNNDIIFYFFVSFAF